MDDDENTTPYIAYGDRWFARDYYIARLIEDTRSVHLHITKING